jgi:hypothetical protein
VVKAVVIDVVDWKKSVVKLANCLATGVIILVSRKQERLACPWPIAQPQKINANFIGVARGPHV